MVAALCAERGIPHATLRPKVSRNGNLQAHARAARYAALGAWAELRGLSALVTAHHADDQAETLLMRLNRGAGVRGLAAMRPVACVPGHPPLPLLRPLLGWRKSELEAVVAAAGLTPANDPSNADRRFERAGLRQALAAAPWLDPTALAASAAHLGEADTALDWAAAGLFAQAQVTADAIIWAHADTPRALALRVLERIVARLGSSQPRGAEIARWHDALSQGRVATLAGVRGDGRKPDWRFTRAAPPGRKLSARLLAISQPRA